MKAPKTYVDWSETENHLKQIEKCKARRKRLEHERNKAEKREPLLEWGELYSYKARYNKPIRILVRTVQLI